MKEESIEKKMLHFFELEKELGDDRIENEDKNNRILARRLYKNFEKSYP